MQIKLLLFILLALVVVVFSVLNPQPVVVNFGFWSAPSVPLAAVIVASVAVGALIMALIGLLNQVRQAFKMREMHRRLEQTEEELQQERNRADALDGQLTALLESESPPTNEQVPEGDGQGGN